MQLTGCHSMTWLLYFPSNEHVTAGWKKGSNFLLSILDIRNWPPRSHSANRPWKTTICPSSSPCMINFEIAYKKGTRSWIALIHENQQTQAQITTRNCVKITCLVTSNIHQQSSYHPSIYTTHGADEKETWRSRTVLGLGKILIQLTSNKMRLHSGHQNENNSCSLMPNIFMVKDKPMLLRSGIGP